MPDVICDTSPLQYLYQIDHLHILPSLVGEIIVPPAVVLELDVGRQRGIRLPDLTQYDWIFLRRPIGQSAMRLVSEFGNGEREVLALGLETPGATIVLDDFAARREAVRLNIPLTGTVGLLLDAKQAGLIQTVAPLLSHLERLRFRLSRQTRFAILELAGEYE